MKTITFTQPHNLNKLCDELFAEFPEWRFRVNGDYHTNVKVSGDGSVLVLEVTDDTDDARLSATVLKHDPSPVVKIDPLKALLDATDDEATVSADEKSFFHKLYDRMTGTFLPEPKSSVDISKPNGRL